MRELKSVQKKRKRDLQEATTDKKTKLSLQLKDKEIKIIIPITPIMMQQIVAESQIASWF